MDNKDSFLHIENLTEENREQLLLMRRVLFNSVIENMKKEKIKGMYLVSLAIFSEFERLTRHITEPKIIKS